MKRKQEQSRVEQCRTVSSRRPFHQSKFLLPACCTSAFGSSAWSIGPNDLHNKRYEGHGREWSRDQTLLVHPSSTASPWHTWFWCFSAKLVILFIVHLHRYSFHMRLQPALIPSCTCLTHQLFWVERFTLKSSDSLWCPPISDEDMNARHCLCSSSILFHITYPTLSHPFHSFGENLMPCRILTSTTGPLMAGSVSPLGDSWTGVAGVTGVCRNTETRRWFLCWFKITSCVDHKRKRYG